MSIEAPVMTETGHIVMCSVVEPAIFMRGYRSDLVITIECGGLAPHRCVFYGLDVLAHHIKSIGVSKDDANYLCSYLDQQYLDMILACRNSTSALNYLVSSDNFITLDDRCKEILTSCGLWSR
jgi:hypothetical protein